MTTRRLILVRHCDEEPGMRAWPRLTDLHAWQEYEEMRPLTDQGRRRAADLAGRIRALQPGALLSSPILRAVETSTAISEATGLEIEERTDLAEIRFGHVRGLEPRTTHGWRKPFTRIPAPRAFGLALMRGLWLMGRTRGVLSPAAAMDRAWDTREALEERGEENLVVVAHGVTLLYLGAVLTEKTRFAAFRSEHLLKTGEIRVLEQQGSLWREIARDRGVVGAAPG